MAGIQQLTLDQVVRNLSHNQFTSRKLLNRAGQVEFMFPNSPDTYVLTLAEDGGNLDFSLIFRRKGSNSSFQLWRFLGGGLRISGGVKSAGKGGLNRTEIAGDLDAVVPELRKIKQAWARHALRGLGVEGN